jgi:hypothetical protein
LLHGTWRENADAENHARHDHATAITGSCLRPLWFDASLGGRSFKAALGDSRFRAVAATIN